MPYFATGNLDHNNKEYKRGQEVVGLSEGEIKTLQELGAITENGEGVDAVQTDVPPAVVEHPNPSGEVQPSQIPHPVEAEQARIEADFENRQATEAEVAQAGQGTDQETTAQPSPEEIEQTLAATDGTQQTVVAQAGQLPQQDQ